MNNFIDFEQQIGTNWFDIYRTEWIEELEYIYGKMTFRIIERRRFKRKPLKDIIYGYFWLKSNWSQYK
jgi:hypothetical protein